MGFPFAWVRLLFGAIGQRERLLLDVTDSFVVRCSRAGGRNAKQERQEEGSLLASSGSPPVLDLINNACAVTYSARVNRALAAYGFRRVEQLITIESNGGHVTTSLTRSASCGRC